MRAAGSALVLIGAVAAIATVGGGGGLPAALLAGGGGQGLDWSAFDQQLHSDWVKRAQAHKKGMSSAQMALQERKEEDERRMLAQKRLEVKKVAEEKEMEQLERNIELEASNQLAAHNTELSDAIVQSAPQLQPQVVFQGHFEPGYDAKSPGEAAAELAAWGPTSDANWARVLAQQRKESQLASYQPTVNYNPIPQQRSAALRTGPGSTGGDALHTAWLAENELRAAAKTEDLADVKAAAMKAADHPGITKGQPALTRVLAQWLHKSVGVEHKLARSANKPPVPVGQVAMSAALAGRTLSTRVPAAGSAAAKLKEMSLEAQLAHEQAQNAILKEKLMDEQLKAAEASLTPVQKPVPAVETPAVETPVVAAAAVALPSKWQPPAASLIRATLRKAAQLPVVHAKSANEQSKWAMVMAREKQQQTPALPESGPLRCCDDSCETVSHTCNALSPVHMQPPANLASKAKAATTLTAAAQVAPGGAGGSVPKDANEKQLVQFLISGTPAQKHQAAGLLYHQTQHHDEDAKVKVAAPSTSVQKNQELVKPVKEVFVKGIRRCCDSSCNYVNTVCPNTHELDQHAVKLYAAGEGPSQSQLSQWLVSGTQLQKDEAAAVFFAINHGVVAKEKKLLDKKKAAITASNAPPAAATQQQVQSSGGGHPDALEGSGSANTGALAQGGHGSYGHSQSAMQAGQLVSEAENIVGNLAAEGH